MPSNNLYVVVILKELLPVHLFLQKVYGTINVIDLYK